MSESILTRLQRAGSKGISPAAAVKELLPVAAAKETLSLLLREGEVVKLGRSLVLRQFAPTVEGAAEAITTILLKKLDHALSAAQLGKQLSATWKKLLAPGLQHLKEQKLIAELHAGRSRLFVHRDAVAVWFETKPQTMSTSPAEREHILTAYRKLIEHRGGFRTVPISELARASALEIPKLHDWIRGEIEAGRANIYRSSSAVTPQSMLDAAMQLHNDPEPYVSVEFYD